MTKTQRNKIIQIIKKDATLFGKYVGKLRSGDACVIGGLALAAGMKWAQLRVGGSIEQRPLIASRIERVFGLPVERQAALQEVNDAHRIGTAADVIAERRADLISLVKSWRTT